MSYIKNWTLLAFITLLIFLVAFVIVESTLRIFWPQIYPPHPYGLYTHDADIGYSLTPNYASTFQGAEFNVSVTTNSSGLRGHELKEIKQNTLRVLCLGDSFTWGWGVEDSEAYPAVLEEKLQNNNPSIDIQVLNAGVPGYGTDEELRFLKKRGSQLNPNIIIAQFFAGNDFSDNRTSAVNTTEIRDGMLYEIIQTDMPQWINIINWLKQKSHLIHLISNRVGYLAMRIGILSELEKSSSEYFTQQDETLTSKYILEIANYAEIINADLLFVFIPEKSQILSKPTNQLRAATLLKKTILDTDAEFLDITDKIQNLEKLELLYFVQDAHWTPEGHNWMAAILSQWFDEHDLIQE